MSDPVSAWAEAEGNKGEMTRTWYSVAGQDVFMVAGIWLPALQQVNAIPTTDRCTHLMAAISARIARRVWLDSFRLPHWLPGRATASQ